VISATISFPLLAWNVGACNRDRSHQEAEHGDAAVDVTALLSEDEARQIALRDAVQHYSNLAAYDVRATRDGFVWHVEYMYTGKGVGGGPTYLIDARSGEILHKEYHQ
jgi:hypothetical protein